MRFPRMDLHLHTRLSDGQATLEQLLEQAERNRLDYLCLTDHVDGADPAPYRRGPSAEAYLEAGRFLRDRFAGSATRFLFGAETCPTGGEPPCTDPLAGLGGAEGAGQVGPERPNLPPPVAAAMEFIVGSVHYVRDAVHRPTPGDYFDPVYWEGYKREVIGILRNSAFTALGHIEGYMPLSPLLLPDSTFEQRREIEREVARRFFTPDWQEEVAATAAASGVCIELHVATQTPRPEFVQVLLAHKVRLTIGTDAHVPEKIGEIDWALDLLERVGARPDDLWLPGE